MARILGNWKVSRPVPEGPARMATHTGLAYALWLPSGPPEGSVLVIHGADSCQESHFDFARAARAHGLAALTYDQRGHGASDGELDARLVDDAVTMAGLLPAGPLAVRGSSLGGYVALLAAERLRAAAVVAICPAGAEHLRRGLNGDRFDFACNRQSLQGFLTEHDLSLALETMEAALLLLHAEGDEQIPVDHSAALYRDARTEHKRFVALPGGHHRSVAHDPELQAESLRFIDRAFGRAGREQTA